MVAAPERGHRREPRPVASRAGTPTAVVEQCRCSWAGSESIQHADARVGPRIRSCGRYVWDEVVVVLVAAILHVGSITYILAAVVAVGRVQYLGQLDQGDLEVSSIVFSVVVTW